MSRVVIVEAAARLDASGKVAFRWTCRCGASGDWTDLNAAESDGSKHNREQHAEVSA